MVESARYLKGLAGLILRQGLDVSLGLLNIGRLADNLDAGLAAALARDVNGDLELRLETTLDIATTANQRSVLLNRDLDSLSNLVFALSNNGLDLLNNAVDDRGATLDLDGVVAVILLGELDGTSNLTTIIGTAGLDDNITDGRTYREAELEYFAT